MSDRWCMGHFRSASPESSSLGIRRSLFSPAVWGLHWLPSDPNAMPLGTFVAEVMEILRNGPYIEEVLVSQVHRHRFAAEMRREDYATFFEIRNQMIAPFYEQTEVLTAGDIAAGVAYMVTRPRHTAIGELWIMPTDQA